MWDQNGSDLRYNPHEINQISQISHADDMSYEQALTPPFYCRGRPADMSITADKDQFLGWTNRTVYDSNKAESENWTLSGLEQKNDSSRPGAKRQYPTIWRKSLQNLRGRLQWGKTQRSNLTPTNRSYGSVQSARRNENMGRYFQHRGSSRVVYP